MFCGSRCGRLAVWVKASMMRLLRLIWMRSQTLYGLFFSGTAENLQRFAGMPKALPGHFDYPSSPPTLRVAPVCFLFGDTLRTVGRDTG